MLFQRFSEGVHLKCPFCYEMVFSLRDITAILKRNGGLKRCKSLGSFLLKLIYLDASGDESMGDTGVLVSDGELDSDCELLEYEQESLPSTWNTTKIQWRRFWL